MAGPGVNADGDQLRSFDVIKPRVQYYLVQCRPDVDYESIRDKACKTGSAASKKGSSLTLPPDDKLWKKLYTIAVRRRPPLPRRRRCCCRASSLAF